MTTDGKPQSKYARKRAGTYKPKRVPQRASWFLRLGWADFANHNLKASAAEIDRRTQGEG